MSLGAVLREFAGYSGHLAKRSMANTLCLIPASGGKCFSPITNTVDFALTRIKLSALLVPIRRRPDVPVWNCHVRFSGQLLGGGSTEASAFFFT